jgi:hypothetical protein
MKLELPRQIIEKHLKFQENPSSGGLVVPRGRKDTRDEATSSFLQFCEGA